MIEKMDLMMNQVAQYRGLEDEFTIIFFGLCERYESRTWEDYLGDIWLSNGILLSQKKMKKI